MDPRNRRPGRGESPEIAELKRIKNEQPELASAADLQIGLLELQRRIQHRVPLPRMDWDTVKRRQQAGEPILRFDDIPLSWTDFRLMFREVASLLRRLDMLDPEEHERILRLTREAHTLEALTIRWYNAAALRAHASRGGQDDPLSPMLEQIILFAMRPFLMRCAEALIPRLDPSAWTAGYCPLCGGEPEFAVIIPSAERLLVCGRCSGRWRYDPLHCPFCGNNDRSQITSFASRDGLYRMYACNACMRYVKAFDGRRAPRPFMVPADLVASLPLDAAVMEKGYTSE